VLGGGLVILYLLLFGIVHHGSRTIVRQQRRLLKQALHDDLTDLPNRTLLYDRVHQAIDAGQRAGTSAALLLMDVDRFKEINDTFGHHYGDLLLQQVGSRLQGTVRESDTIARLGGDEFAVLLPNTPEPAALMVAERVLAALGEPFTVNGYSLQVGASIGISFSPQHGTGPSALLQRADVAMYHAKRTGSGFSAYAPEHDEYSQDRLALVNELRQAIDEDQLVLYYQPKICLKTNRIHGVEALVRWQHPYRGLIPPDEFIPLAEHTGLIKPLTHWVLNRALQQCGEWCAAELELSVAVNLSARSLHDPQLTATVAALLQTWGVPAARLEVELTESALMTDPTRGEEIFGQLRAMGVRIAIDDFGTGYSSLAYLKRLPVDEIKIDKSFVLDMGADDGEGYIVRSIADLGHSLGLDIVAEGVENQQCLRRLTLMGCDLAQGYHLSAPLPPERLLSWMQTSGAAIAT
jgi:diguanylate cyclase (GGDEF)-like protein